MAYRPNTLLAGLSALTLLIAVTTPVTPAAAQDGRPADAPVDFNRDIRPILGQNCLKCHGPDPDDRKAGLRLDTREGAIADRKGTHAVMPGNVAASALIARVTADDDERMPPAKSGKRLTKAEVDLLKRWIEQGADYAQHWAYMKPLQAALPKVAPVRGETWPRNAIDAFVLARLRGAGLEPSLEADRLTWLRRVTLDLTGLPPTLVEAEAFINDKSDNAYEKVVDRLLSSSAYGERWARVWLDLARYADSAGYAQDPPRVIWRYRDWVISAINKNMPLDRFTIEQFAGDLLPAPKDADAANELLIATAFHRNTMTNSEGGTNDEEFRNAAVIDRVNTTMQVWMGMTMSCAQCHNHKYDPISQREYFEVFAILNNTEDADRGNEAPTLNTYTAQQIEQRKKLEQQVTELELIIAQKTLEAKKRGRPTQHKATAGPLKTRYVRVENLGKGVFLHLAEVQAFIGDQNVARKGKASQISTDYGGPAHLAIDGNTNGDYTASKSVSHTAQADNPWWEVDLGSAVTLDKVVLWNRTDNGLASRLKSYRVVLLDDMRQPIWVMHSDKVFAKDLALTLPKSADKLDAKTQAAIAQYAAGGAGATLQFPEQKKLDALKKQLGGIKGVPTPIMRELTGNRRRKTHIQVRGNFQVKGDEVSPGTPGVFPKIAATGEGNQPSRLDLARWLVSDDNPLTARVTVNRYWEQLFGQGLVRTSEDFGVQGELPSHPQLLDWLAVDLMKNGWDTKRLVKQIVLSATYRQTSRVTPDLLKADSDNRLLSRGPRFRLSAEMIRDQALAVSGLLSRKMYGPSVRPPQPKLGIRAAFGGSTDWDPSPGEDRYRRGLYTFWRRTTPYPSMLTFDATSREVCTIRRVRTNTPLQAFVTLNDPVFVEAAQALGRRAVREGGQSVNDRMTYAFKLCLTRAPKDKELQRLVGLYQDVLSVMRAKPQAATALATDPIGPLPKGADAAELAAWTVVSNVLMNLDEFLARP